MEEFEILSEIHDGEYHQSIVLVRTQLHGYVTVSMNEAGDWYLTEHEGTARTRLIDCTLRGEPEWVQELCEFLNESM